MVVFDRVVLHLKKLPLAANEKASGPAAADVPADEVGAAPKVKAVAAGAATDGAAPKLNVCPLAGNPNEGVAAEAAAGAAAPKVKAVAPAGLPNEKLMFLNLQFRELCKEAAPNVVILVC